MVKASADFQKAAHASIEVYLPRRRLGNTGKDLQQCAFACAIAPDNTDHFTGLNLKGDVPQRPECLALGTLQGMPERVNQRFCHRCVLHAVVRDCIVFRHPADGDCKIGC